MSLSLGESLIVRMIFPTYSCLSHEMADYRQTYKVLLVIKHYINTIYSKRVTFIATLTSSTKGSLQSPIKKPY